MYCISIMLGEVILEYPIIFAVLPSIIFGLSQSTAISVKELNKEGRGKYIKPSLAKFKKRLRGKGKEKNTLVKPIISSVIYGIILYVFLKLIAGPLYIKESRALAEWGLGVLTVPFMEITLDNIATQRTEKYISNNQNAMKGDLYLSNKYMYKSSQYQWEKKLMLWIILTLVIDRHIVWGGVVGLIIVVVSLIIWERRDKVEKEIDEETKDETQEPLMDN